jgi:hypothetical protein
MNREAPKPGNKIGSIGFNWFCINDGLNIYILIKIDQMTNTINEEENEELIPKSKRHDRPKKETDLPDNPHDEERMKPEEVILDLPDVEEIPGQEYIHVPQFREMQDVTIASDDEEGVGVFGDDEDEEDIHLVSGRNDDIGTQEEGLLEKGYTDMPGEDENLRKSELDQDDDDGTPLNEGSTATDVSGGDLDTSGTDEDDQMEDIGEEDEENNFYSLGGDNNESLDGDKS